MTTPITTSPEMNAQIVSILRTAVEDPPAVAALYAAQRIEELERGLREIVQYFVSAQDLQTPRNGWAVANTLSEMARKLLDEKE